MGIYRFLLSVMVLLSHSGIYYYEFNQGIVAVISFLIISGYTTDITLENKYDHQPVKTIKNFYIDRVIRILPQYWFYVIITLIIVFIFHLKHETIHEITFKTIGANILLFPLDYASLFGVFATIMAKCDVIPAAWTIGMQFTYYLIAPFLRLIQRNKSVKLHIINYFLFGVSFFIFFLSIMGIIPSDYSYVLLPGMLWIFMLGAYMRDESKKLFIFGICILVFLVFLYIGMNKAHVVGHNKEVLLGVIIGMPIVYSLKYFPRYKVDTFLGDLSYGIFLNHFTIKEIMISIIKHEPSCMTEWIILICISTFISIISCYLIEYPIKKLKQTSKLNLTANNNS